MTSQKAKTNESSSSELRLLVVINGENSVSHPRPAREGKRITWINSADEQCSLTFDEKELELSPEVKNGDFIEWINPTSVPCTVKFRPSESPFEGNVYQWPVAPGHSVPSPSVKGEAGPGYSYEVNFSARYEATEGTGKGSPQVIVK